MKRFLTVVAAMIMIASLSGAAVITTYNNQTNWQNAVGTWSTFQFTGNFNAQSGGTVITPVNSGSNPPYGVISGNEFTDLLASGVLPNQNSNRNPSTTTYSWSGGPMTAAGGLFDTSPINEGGKINIVLNLVNGLGTQVVINMLGPLDGFFGWTSDTPFNSFTLSTNNNLQDNFLQPYGLEHYNLDNLQVSTVPEPATLSIVGLALLGLGAFRRYRRS